MRQQTSQLADGRAVTYEPVYHGVFSVFVADELAGMVKTQERFPHGESVTSMMNAQYGKPLTRSMGFGSREVFVVCDSRGMQVSPMWHHQLDGAIREITSRFAECERHSLLMKEEAERTQGDRQ